MHSHKYIFPILLLAAATLGAGRGTAGRAPDSQPATAPKSNVTIQPPKNWNVTPGTGGGRSVLAATAPQADTDATGKFQASLSITQDAGTKVDAPAQQANLAKQMPGYHAVEQPTQITINGMQGAYFGGTFKSGTVELRTRQYMFAVNGQVYTLTFTSLNSTWATYKPVLEGCVATLSVKK